MERRRLVGCCSDVQCNVHRNFKALNLQEDSQPCLACVVDLPDVHKRARYVALGLETTETLCIST